MDKERRIVEPLDWRYSAAIVGLVKYFEYLEDEVLEEPDWNLESDRLEFDSADITEENYLGFVEREYPEDMHHVQAENILKAGNTDESSIKIVNEKLAANTVLKKLFKGIKYDGSNAEMIQKVIDENRQEIVRETFRNKNNLYRNYCNTNQLFEDSKDCCRLLGYYVDMPKKGKAMGYNFEMANFVGQDDPIFDFIPFAFHGEREFFFANDNLELKHLISATNQFKKCMDNQKEKAENENRSVDARQVFFNLIIETPDFIENDIEVIVKNVDNTHFETLYLRQESLKIFQNLKSEDGKKYKCFCRKIKVTDNYWVDIFRKVTDAVINLVLLDDLIEWLLKNDKNSKDDNYKYIVKQLIGLNIAIKGDKDLEQRTKVAYACAKAVVQKKDKVADNKLDSYRQKLTSALSLGDYDRFNNLLLNLANYADETFDFAYDLFEDFEKNKELAYTFVNALRRVNK